MPEKLEIPIKIKHDKKDVQSVADEFEERIGKGLENAMKKLGLGSFGAMGGGSSKASSTGTIASGVAAGMAAGGVVALLTVIADFLKDIPMISAIFRIFKVILMLLFLPLIPILKPALEGLIALVKILAPVMESLTKVLDAMPKKEMAGATAGGVIGGVAGALLGGPVGAAIGAGIGTAVGAGIGLLMSKIPTQTAPSSGFGFSSPGTQSATMSGVVNYDQINKDLNDGFQKITKAVNTAADWLIQAAKDSWKWVTTAWSNFKTWVANLWNNVIVTPWKNFVAWVKNLWVTYIEAPWKNFLVWVTNLWDLYIEAPWRDFVNFVKNLWNTYVAPPFQWLGNAIQGVISFIQSLNPFGGGGAKKVNDMILTPNGTFSTSPGDYIIATKDPKSLGGSGGITINVDSPVVSKPQDIKDLVRQISLELAKQNRRYNSYV